MPVNVTRSSNVRYCRNCPVSRTSGARPAKRTGRCVSTALRPLLLIAPLHDHCEAKDNAADGLSTPVITSRQITLGEEGAYPVIAISTWGGFALSTPCGPRHLSDTLARTVTPCTRKIPFAFTTGAVNGRGGSKRLPPLMPKGAAAQCAIVSKNNPAQYAKASCFM